MRQNISRNVIYLKDSADPLVDVDRVEYPFPSVSFSGPRHLAYREELRRVQASFTRYEGCKRFNGW